MTKEYFVKNSMEKEVSKDYFVEDSMEKEFTKDDFMCIAISEARKAYSLKETPIGAVIVLNGRIVGRGYNMVELGNSAIYHAEVMAIQDARRNIGNWRLIGCEMYVTMQPCFMCAGAIVNSRIKHIYVGARHEKNGIVDKHNKFIEEYLRDNNVVVEFGIKNEECSTLLTNFFREKRKKLI